MVSRYFTSKTDDLFTHRQKVMTFL